MDGGAAVGAAVAIAVVDTHAGGRGQVVVFIDHQLAIGRGGIAAGGVGAGAAAIVVGVAEVAIAFTGCVAVCVLGSATETAPEMAPDVAPASGPRVGPGMVVPATIGCAVDFGRAARGQFCGVGRGGCRALGPSRGRGRGCGRRLCCSRSTMAAVAEEVVGVLDEVVVAVSVVFEVLGTVAVVEVGVLVRVGGGGIDRVWRSVQRCLGSRVVAMHAGDVCALALDADDPAVDLETVEADCGSGVGLVGELDVGVALGQAGDAVADNGDPVDGGAAAAGDSVGALAEEHLELPGGDFEGDVGHVDGSAVDFSLVFRLVGAQSEAGGVGGGWGRFGGSREVVDGHGGVVAGEGAV